MSSLDLWVREVWREGKWWCESSVAVKGRRVRGLVFGVELGLEGRRWRGSEGWIGVVRSGEVRETVSWWVWEWAWGLWWVVGEVRGGWV